VQKKLSRVTKWGRFVQAGSFVASPLRTMLTRTSNADYQTSSGDSVDDHLRRLPMELGLALEALGLPAA